MEEQEPLAGIYQLISSRFPVLYMGGVDAGINDAEGGITKFGSAYNLGHRLDNPSRCFPYTMGFL